MQRLNYEASPVMLMPAHFTTRAARGLFLFSLFVVPFSTALTNLSVVLLYVFFAAAAWTDRSLLASFKSRASLAALGLLLLFVLGASWSIAPHKEIGHALVKYSKLLLIPVGIALSQRDNRLAREGVACFIAGATLLAFCSYLVWQDLMPGDPRWWSAGTRQNAYVFKNHITFGIMTILAALLCFSSAFHAATQRHRLLAIALGLFLIIPPLVLTHGRSGYFVVLVGLATLSLIHFRHNWRKLGLSGLIVAGLFVSLHTFSANFQQRTNHLLVEIQSYANADASKSTGVRFADTDKANSAGIRLSFYRAGLAMIAEHPVLGLGTGAFAEAFAPTAKKLWPVDAPEYAGRHQPHSEIILICVQLGLLGGLVYGCLLWFLVLPVRQQPGLMADNLLLLCAVFGSASVFNSLLWDVTEGHAFALLAGCCYGVVSNKRVTKLSLVPKVAEVAA
ncbi:MAG: O-antigen ligase family protein [Pseudomonadota bacterium]